MQKTAISLAERAYDRIEEMIVTLKLPPGSVFSEGELSHELGIGRTPIREALQRLSTERLVAALPRRGMIITEIHIAEQLALLETRRVLERLISTRAARRANGDQRRTLEICAEAIEAAARAQDLDRFLELDREFDQVLDEASGNAFASGACAPLRAHCRRFWYAHRHRGDLARSAELHAAVMHAVAEREESAAASASDRLIDYLESFTRETLDHF